MKLTVQEIRKIVFEWIIEHPDNYEQYLDNVLYKYHHTNLTILEDIQNELNNHISLFYPQLGIKLEKVGKIFRKVSEYLYDESLSENNYSALEGIRNQLNTALFLAGQEFLVVRVTHNYESEKLELKRELIQSNYSRVVLPSFTDLLSQGEFSILRRLFLFLSKAGSNLIEQKYLENYEMALRLQSRVRDSHLTSFNFDSYHTSEEIKRRKKRIEILIEPPRDKFDHIFANDGFRYFDQVTKNANLLEKNTFNQSHIFYIFHEFTNAKYIHCQYSEFQEWFNDTYEPLELNQPKSLTELKKSKGRIKLFSFHFKDIPRL